jgi:hypothetical protein
MGNPRLFRSMVCIDPVMGNATYDRQYLYSTINHGFLRSLVAAWRRRQSGGGAQRENRGSLVVAWWRWQRGGGSLVAAWRRRQQRGGSAQRNGGSSLAEAWRRWQHGGGSTAAATARRR